MIKTFLLIFCLQIFSCTTKTSIGSQSEDVSQLDIDPDQKALPAESDLDTAVDIMEDMDEVSTVSPTPTIEELNNEELNNDEESGPRERLEAAEVEPDAPLYQQSEESFANEMELGSGSAVRYIKAAELNIRERPDRKSAIVGKLRGGQRVKVDIRGGWARLEPDRWIRSKWLSKKQTHKSVEKNNARGPGKKLKANRPKKKSAAKKLKKKRVQTNN
jgi:hypothetical protein